jgi:hypothetical protein
MRESAHKLTLNFYLRKANYDTRKTYSDFGDFGDWCDSSATTGQLWVSLLTAYDSLLTPFSPLLTG